MKYITIQEKGSFALVTIKREPVNSMNLDLWKELRATVTKLESDVNIRGILFNSGLERAIFTAGNEN
jgi:3,2-trans-enoyl-CoA isomerase